jgi:hypothetical protein
MKKRWTIDTEAFQPSGLGEKFVVSLNPEGCPVQRALHEMTATEVLAAIEWHTDEALRLQEQTVSCVEPAEAAEMDILDLEMQDGVRRVAKGGVAAAATTLGKAARLLALVVSALPKHGEFLPLRERILSTWPARLPPPATFREAARDGNRSRCKWSHDETCDD